MFNKKCINSSYIQPCISWMQPDLLSNPNAAYKLTVDYIEDGVSVVSKTLQIVNFT